MLPANTEVNYYLQLEPGSELYLEGLVPSSTVHCSPPLRG